MNKQQTSFKYQRSSLPGHAGCTPYEMFVLYVFWTVVLEPVTERCLHFFFKLTKVWMSYTNTKQNIQLCIKISLARWLGSFHTCFQIWRSSVRPGGILKILKKFLKILSLPKNTSAQWQTWFNIALVYIIHKKEESYTSIIVGYILLIYVPSKECKKIWVCCLFIN